MARRSGRGRSRPWADHYTHAARDAGYAARSVFKLQEMDRRFSLFRPGMRVLDLGAAPGSWTQYLAGRVAAGGDAGGRGSVVAVDLTEVDPVVARIAGVSVVHGDFTATDVGIVLSEKGPFDAVVSDAAPATTGNRTVDTARSAQLVETVLFRLSEWLCPGGTFVAKVFQGGEEQALLAETRRCFRAGRLYRPPAVRKASFESYLIGTDFAGREFESN